MKLLVDSVKLTGFIKFNFITAYYMNGKRDAYHFTVILGNTNIGRLRSDNDPQFCGRLCLLPDKIYDNTELRIKFEYEGEEVNRSNYAKFESDIEKLFGISARAVISQCINAYLLKYNTEVAHFKSGKYDWTYRVTKIYKDDKKRSDLPKFNLMKGKSAFIGISYSNLNSFNFETAVKKEFGMEIEIEKPFTLKQNFGCFFIKESIYVQYYKGEYDKFKDCESPYFKKDPQLEFDFGNET